MSDAILVVDDEEFFCHSLKQLLVAAGYTADTATSGQEAFSHIMAREYAAVLVDLRLSDLDGIDIARYLSENRPECSIIIVTGQATVTSAVEALRLGCYDYITKMHGPNQILHTLKRALEIRSLKKQLAASNTKYQRLAEATWESIVFFSEEGIHEVNSQFCKLFEVNENQARSLSLNHFIPGLILSSHGTPIDDEDPEQVIEIEAIRSNGTIFPAEIRLKQSWENGKCLWIAAIRDLSQRQQEERTRLRLEEKLTYAMRMESIGIMAGSVAHDLNNILSGIVTFPELLLLDMPVDSTYRKDIERIKNAGQKAAEVVADLLTIARGSTAEKKTRSLNMILSDYRDSLEYLNDLQSFPDISIDITLDPLLLDTQVSSIHVLKSLLNLVRNAVEAIDQSGSVKIYTALRRLQDTYLGYESIPPGQYAVLGVADTGKGISEQHLPHIFQPFYSRKQMGMSGTGLGLTIIRHTMRDHSGYIDLRSGKEGTVFELYFPICQEQQQSVHDIVNLVPFLGKGEKVLIIDDEEHQRLLTSSLLKRLGYTPCIAENGEQAIRFLREMPVDLLLLDLIMEPGMTGYETFKEIQRLLPAQKVVITSGHHNHPDLEKIRALGNSRYLPKPLDVIHLAVALQQEMKA